MEICQICGRPAECVHHLIFGYGMRQLCDEDGIVMHLCNGCHNMNSRAVDRIHENVMAEHLSKICGQQQWELKAIIGGCSEDEARKLFIKRYGRSWL